MNPIKLFKGKFNPYNGVKTPVILQYIDTECGIAALAIILSYYGTDLTLESLREQCGTSRDGCKAITLLNVAKNYGFNADAYRIDLEDIKSLTQPVIAFWNFNHYVVIEGVGYRKLFINDPACGPITISFDEFDRAFTGVIIVLSPTSNQIKMKKSSSLTVLLKEWIFHFYRELFYILICLLIIIFCPLLNSTLATVFVDHCIIANDLSWLPAIAFLSLASTAIFINATASQKWHQFKLGTKTSIVKSASVLLHILKLPMSFYSLRQKSEIISIVNSAERIVNLLFKSTTTIFFSLITTVVCLFFMFKLDRLLCFVSIILVMSSCLIFILISKFNFSLEKSLLVAHGKVYSQSMSNIKNIETIKACGLEENSLHRWYGLFCQKISWQDKSNTLSLGISAINNFSDSLSMLLILGLGGYQIGNGIISVGSLMAYYSLHLFFYNNLNSLFSAGKETQSIITSHDRMNDILNAKVDQRFVSKAVVNAEVNAGGNYPAILCKNIKFRYNKNSVIILDEINLEIKQGQHVAFVGNTGSGKSTLAKLLCALYSPTNGEVILFGKEISTYSSDELAQIISYMSQDVTLFSGTLQENITLWQSSIPAGQIQSAVENSCLNELIELRGLNGRVEECGANFSGGEKQRIDLARALIRNTRIVILDESTSSLDAETEKKIVTNLRKNNKTIIYVAHRLSSIKHCDQIIVIENGVIVERGTHANLLANKHYYYQLSQREKM
ncbi:MAG: cysteine peptidase family C39 domain-containing protein [Gammaproteobacteria bacterium]